MTVSLVQRRELTHLVALELDRARLEDVVAGLGACAAHERRPGWEHSIAQLLAHVVAQQERTLQAVVLGREPVAPDEALAWPQTTPEEWPLLVRRFERACADARQLAASADLPWVTAGERSIAYHLAAGAQHTAHHLGEIAFMRRLLAA